KEHSETFAAQAYARLFKPQPIHGMAIAKPKAAKLVQTQRSCSQYRVSSAVSCYSKQCARVRLANNIPRRGTSELTYDSAFGSGQLSGPGVRPAVGAGRRWLHAS